MSYKDKLKQLTDEVIAQATSDEVRQKAKAATLAGKEKAQAFASSESGQRLIGAAQALSRDVVANIAKGDSIKKAAAKATKDQVRAQTANSDKNKPPPTD